MNDPKRRHMLEIDPDSPGLFGILRGEKGPEWMWCVRIALVIIAFLNLVEIFTVLN